MTLDEAVNFYVTPYRLCKTLGVSHQNYGHWQSKGYIPELQQWRLMFLTEGRLKIDNSLIENLLSHNKTMNKKRYS